MSSKRTQKPVRSILFKGLDKEAKATIARWNVFLLMAPIHDSRFTCSLLVCRWLIRPGDFVHEGKTLLRYHLGEEGKELVVRADQSGVVNQILAQNGDTIVNGQALCELRDCAHDESIGGICTNCGSDVTLLEKVPQLLQLLYRLCFLARFSLPGYANHLFLLDMNLASFIHALPNTLISSARSPCCP
jgi:hypothetical protein